MGIFELFFKYLMFSLGKLSHQKTNYLFQRKVLLESMLESAQWNSLHRSFQDNFIHLEKKKKKSSLIWHTIKRFLQYLQFVRSLYLGVKWCQFFRFLFFRDEASWNSTREKQLKVIWASYGSIFPCRHGYRGKELLGGPQGERLAIETCYVDGGAPLTGCPARIPVVRIAPRQRGAHLSRPRCHLF